MDIKLHEFYYDKRTNCVIQITKVENRSLAVPIIGKVVQVFDDDTKWIGLEFGYNEGGLNALQLIDHPLARIYYGI